MNVYSLSETSRDRDADGCLWEMNTGKDLRRAQSRIMISMDKKKKNPPAWKTVYDSLKSQILMGVYGKDTYLTEVSIAEQFHVSRTPVRDAVKSLIAEGFLTSVHRKGLKINYSRDEDAFHLFYVFKALEPISAKLAALNRTDEEMEELMTIHKRDLYYNQDEGQNPPALSNYNFHIAIAKASHNPYIFDFVKQLHTHLLSIDAFGINVDAYSNSEKPNAQLILHEKILDAIANRDADLAEFLMNRHIDQFIEMASKNRTTNS